MADDLRLRLYVGDCVEVLDGLPRESVDSVVTSPPYAMQRSSQYGGIEEAEFPGWSVSWMRAVRRVLKPHGSVLAVIRPHIRKGEISDYVLRTRLALRDDGWIEAEELIWFKPDGPPMGHLNRPRRSFESVLWFSKHGRPYCDPKANGTSSNQLGLTGGRKGVDQGYVQEPGQIRTGVARCQDVIRIPLSANERVEHPAPYPVDLAEWMIKLVTPPGGTVLDPFAGSCSTGVAALRNGFRFVGIDVRPDYIAASTERLGGAAE